MIRLLSSKDRRQLEIINVFRKEPHAYYTYQDLANLLGCAKGTIMTDLTDIRRLFGDQVTILQSGAGVNLEFHRDVPDSFYFRRFSQQSINFRILNELLYHTGQPVESVSQKLFVSRSSIYRAVKQINDFARAIDLDLEVTTSPLGIKGSELLVRLAGPFFITHFYSVVDWPFQHISLEEAIRLYQLMASQSPYLKVFTSNPLVYIQIAFNFESYVLGFKLDSQEWTISNQKLQALLEGQDLFANLTAQDRDYPLMEVIPQVVPGLVGDSTMINIDQLERNYQDQPEALQAIANFQLEMKRLKRAYDFQVVDESDMQLIALTIYNLCRIVHGTINIIVDDPIAHESNLVEEIGEINPTYLRDVQVAIETFVHELGVTMPREEHITQTLVFYYLLIWPNTIKELSKDRVIDLLIYTGNYHYDLEYKAALEPTIKNFVNVHVQHQPLNWQELSRDNPYQIIMSSYYLPESIPSRVYYIKAMPDAETYSWIYQAAQEILGPDDYL
ncbi:helix-turn-helix domain-containing protein [Hutsoniella sourekii]|uniref:helix-turn-helix domain-containing protein n=1 Tax=Hutsoniella sourekii TaxID=87650 RepID=UPI0004871D75|nr:helix-turn-helix domain-containing protein [Hutsoniella sourekii]